MLLLWAIVIGLLVSSIRAWVRGRHLMSLDLRLAWLVPLAFVLQLFAFYLPTTRNVWDDKNIVAVGLVTSQILLLVFAWFNHRQPGFWLLGLGLALNLLVIAFNEGLMPITPELAESLTSRTWEAGSRLGNGKDVVLSMPKTRLWFLSDRFLIRLPNPVAFSIGDVLIATGAFWLLWAMGESSLRQRPVFTGDHKESR